MEFAWREWREARARSLGAALDDDELRPPRWFVREEIGYAFEHGPSLWYTCSVLAKINRAALRQLGAEAPARVTWPRDFWFDGWRRKRAAPRAGARRTWLPRNVREGRHVARCLTRFFRGGARAESVHTPRSTR